MAAEFVDSSPDLVHDEFISDTFYATGWTTQCTSSSCKNKDCKCKGSGSCVYNLFNHYMKPDDSSSAEDTDPCLTFPVFLHSRSVDEISAEEIRCSPANLGKSYRYFRKQVVTSPREQTLLSVALNKYKSPCFSVECRLIEMKRESAYPGSFCFPSRTDGNVHVLAHDGIVLTPLLESICMIGIDPVVSSKGVYGITMLSGKSKGRHADLFTSGFTYSTSYGVNIIGSMREGASEMVELHSDGSTRAVRTAVVTLSVVLTPRSYYGGKNPSTKTVSYHIHNVELE